VRVPTHLCRGPVEPAKDPSANKRYRFIWALGGWSSSIRGERRLQRGEWRRTRRQ
jgi:hypothetical protein